jgi:hypothetical protein
MNIDASIFASDISDRSDDPIESAKHSLVESNERSERNIRMWSSYLPPECVNAMIRMGWDRTT